MQPAEIYKKLIKDISVLLKEKQYKRFGRNVFYTLQQANWGFIGFQKSISSNPHEIRFTINLGICSKALMDFFDPEKKPSLQESQWYWNQRIGFLIPNYGYDKWWFITEQMDSDQLIREIKDIILNDVIPNIEQNISDEQLMTLWLSGIGTGITEVQRLMNLSVLLNKSGNKNKVKSVLEELKKYAERYPAAKFMISQHLLQLNQARK